MKIICTLENLKFGLATTGRIISPSNTLPILSNVMLKTENGQLKILSTNLEIAITTTVRCKIEQEGEVCLPAKTLADLVNTLPNENISIETSENNVIIKTENYNTKIKSLPAEEFPLIPNIETRHSIKINPKELKSAIEQVIFAVSLNESQPEISGVYMDQQEENIKIVATDRYRLAEKNIMAKGQKGAKQSIFPSKAIIETSRLLSVAEESVEIDFGENQAVIKIAETQITTRLIDGQYPDYKQIIPTEFNTTINLVRHDLINALKTSGIFSRGTGSVTLSFNEKQDLVVTSNSQELGESTIKIPSHVEGQGGSMILNHRYILDALNNMAGENIVVKVVNDESPVIFTPQATDEYTYLVMPIKS